MADYDIGAAFAAVEEELIASMIRNFKRHRAEETAEGFQWSQWQADQLDALETYRRRNQKKFGKRFKEYNQMIEAAIVNAYERGGAEQEKEILEAIRMGASLRNHADTLGGSFFHTNERKLDALIQATTGDMERAENAVLRRANDAYRKTIFNAQVYANTGAGTYEKAVDMATRDFLAAGLRCVVYKNGARHTLSDYADMALRTASKRAYLQGEGQKRQEWGVSTVIINRRGGACPECARYCGKVFIDDVWSGGKASDGDYPLLSSAIEGGLYHPRCKDSHSTYFPELYEDEEPYTQEEIKGLERREKAEQRQQYAERMAKQFARLAAFSLDPENIRRYREQAKRWGASAEAEPFARQAERFMQNARAEYGEGLVALAKYEDITGRWYPDAVPGSHEVKDLLEYTAPDGSVYKVHGRDVVLDYTPHEKEIAELLAREVGGEIFMVPKVNNPQGVRTPDYLFHGRAYDLKTLGKDAGPNTMFNRVKKATGQASGIIVDITNTSLADEVVGSQIDKIFRSSETQFVKEIVIVQVNSIRQIIRRK